MRRRGAFPVSAPYPVSMHLLENLPHFVGSHINTGEPCAVYVQDERVLWLPEDEGTEVVLQLSDGEWLVAMSQGDQWAVTHDRWDAVKDERVDEEVHRGDRETAVALLVSRLLG